MVEIVAFIVIAAILLIFNGIRALFRALGNAVRDSQRTYRPADTYGAPGAPQPSNGPFTSQNSPQQQWSPPPPLAGPQSQRPGGPAAGPPRQVVYTIHPGIQQAQPVDQRPSPSPLAGAKPRQTAPAPVQRPSLLQQPRSVQSQAPMSEIAQQFAQQRRVSDARFAEAADQLRQEEPSPFTPDIGEQIAAPPPAPNAWLNATNVQEINSLLDRSSLFSAVVLSIALSPPRTNRRYTKNVL